MARRFLTSRMPVAPVNCTSTAMLAAPGGMMNSLLSSSQPTVFLLRPRWGSVRQRLVVFIGKLDGKLAASSPVGSFCEIGQPHGNLEGDGFPRRVEHELFGLGNPDGRALLIAHSEADEGLSFLLHLCGDGIVPCRRATEESTGFPAGEKCSRLGCEATFRQDVGCFFLRGGGSLTSPQKQGRECERAE